MTLDELSHRYFSDWLKGKYTEGKIMMRSCNLSTKFIDEARYLSLAADEDIMAEAETLEDAMNDKIANWSCQ
jgi:hypothetical protein